MMMALLPRLGWLLAAATITTVVLARKWLRREKMFTAVVEHVDVSPNNCISVLRVVGRTAGLWGWLLHNLNIGRTYVLHASERLVTIRAPGFWRESHVAIPVSQLAVVSANFSFPFGYILYGLAGGSILRMFMVPHGLSLAVVLSIVLCVLNRQFQILVSAGDGHFGFRYSLGASCTKQQLFSVVEQLRMLLVRVQENTAMSSLSTSFSAAPPALPPPPLGGAPGVAGQPAAPQPWPGAGANGAPVGPSAPPWHGPGGNAFPREAGPGHSAPYPQRQPGPSGPGPQPWHPPGGR